MTEPDWLDWLPTARMCTPGLMTNTKPSTSTRTRGYAPNLPPPDIFIPFHIVGSDHLLPRLMEFGRARLKRLSRDSNSFGVPRRTLEQHNDLLAHYEPGRVGRLGNEASTSNLFVRIYTLVGDYIIPELENRSHMDIRSQVRSEAVDIIMDHCLLDERENIVVAVECKSHRVFDKHVNEIQDLAFIGRGTTVTTYGHPTCSGGESIVLKVSPLFCEYG
jgi:hypothetical protein